MTVLPARNSMWFYSTIALACISVGLGVGLYFALSQEPRHVVEPRLIGTWISDADKTIEMMRASTDTTSESFQKTKQVLGKMKVSFSAIEIAVTLDGQTDRAAYRVLASDAYSCAVEEVEDNSAVDKEMADIMRLSTFSVIHFEDQDTYWVQSQFGGFSEYFRRISE